MMRSTMVLMGFVLLVTPAAAQLHSGGNSAFVYEQYSFDSGLAYSGISELTVPLTFSTYLSNRTHLTVSGGLTRVSLTGDPDVGLEDKEISGIVDTEARLVVDLIPDRLSFLATAVVPTGIEALEVQEETILAALSSPVIGFSTTRLGGGGRIGGGLVGVVPVGQMALGMAGTYTHSVGYSPVLGHDMEWQPGAEIRLRAGLEGTVGPQSYLRVATVFASRQADKLDGEEKGEVGTQIHFYAALNQGLGSSSLTLYLIDSYRSAPQIEATSVGAVQVPKGNLIALGGKLDFPLSRGLTIVPKAEFRRMSEAPRDRTGSGSLESAGSTLRAGADLKYPLNPNLSLVVEATGLFGSVGVGDGTTVGTSGFRGGVHLVFRR